MSIYRASDWKKFYLASLLYESIDDNDFSGVKSLILEKGADPNHILSGKGISPFHLAVGCDFKEFSLKVTRFILQNGGNPNVRSVDGLTPVHIAAAWGRHEILRLLLECGGDVEARDSNRFTPIHYAYSEDHKECLKVLAHHLPDRREVLLCNGRKDEEANVTIVLDKILISNGHNVGEYEIVDEHKTDSINILPDSNLDNLPQSNPKENVMNWFNNHIDDINERSYEKFVSNLDSSSDNFPSFESSIDESDNDNYRLSKTFNITFRKAYTKRRKVSKTSEKSVKSSGVSSSENEIDTSENLVPPETRKYVNFKESSEQSDTATMPNSKQIKDALNKEEKEQVACSGYRSGTSKVAGSEKTTQPIPCVKVEEACSGYKSYSIRDKNQSLKKLVSETSSGYKSSSTNQKTSCPFKKETVEIKTEPKSLIIDTTNDKSDPQLLNKVTQTSYVQGDNMQRQSTDNSESYVTCSLLSNKFEKNIFEITEDLSADSAKTLNSVNNMSDLSFVSVSEVYRYEDEQEGVVLYEKRLLKAPSECNASIMTASSKMSSLPEYFDYDTDTLRKELTVQGFTPGPITISTKRVYLKKLYQLKKRPPVVAVDPSVSAKKVYSVELEKTLRDSTWVSDLVNFKSLEEVVSGDFSNPDTTRKWREGINKSSFTYLLLDPRITDNLPRRAELLKPREVWETFLSSIFYVGKGKRSRPYSHLYDAVTQWRLGKTHSNNAKLNTILEIWRDSSGVVCLHVFQNTIPVEAYTREAAMISALKLDNLTNVKPGDFYGRASTWTQKQKKLLGVYLLYKAMKIFLNEGERQLYPQDIN